MFLSKFLKKNIEPGEESLRAQNERKEIQKLVELFGVNFCNRRLCILAGDIEKFQYWNRKYFEALKESSENYKILNYFDFFVQYRMAFVNDLTKPTFDALINDSNSVFDTEQEELSILLARRKQQINKSLPFDYRLGTSLLLCGSRCANCRATHEDVSLESYYVIRGITNEAYQNAYEYNASEILCETCMSNVLIEYFPDKRIEIDSLGAFEFEVFISKLFKKMGYQVEVTPKSGDFGVDVVAWNSTEKVAIQAKKYSSNHKVGNREVQQLLGAMQFKNVMADKGILVTSSSFTRPAFQQAEGNPVELWDKNKLCDLIIQYW